MNRQRGYTLVEMLIALGALSAVIVSANTMISRFNEDARIAIAADHMKVVGEAGKAFIKDNAASIIANPAAVQTYQVADLIAAGHLPAGFSAHNGYQQTMCLRVAKSGINIHGMVVADGLGQLDEATVAQFAQQLGSWGGGIYADAPAQAIGIGGGWSVPTATFAGAARCTGASGGVFTGLSPGRPVLALWFDNSLASTGFLYRQEVPGQPELNRMETHIDMGGNRVRNLQVATSGVTCTQNGDIGMDSVGEVLACQSGVWREQRWRWGDPVENFGALPACNASINGQTRVVQNATDGANRPRAYTCYGASWRPLSLDDDGNLFVPGFVNINGSLRITGTTVLDSARNLTNINTAQVENSTRVGNRNVDQTPTAGATGTVATGTAQLKRIVTINTACPTLGEIATNNVGVVMSCQNLGAIGQRWQKAVDYTELAIGTPRTIDGWAVTYVGGGMWLDATNKSAVQYPAAWDQCRARGAGWSLPTSADLARAAPGAANRTTAHLWSTEWSAYAEYRGRYHSAWTVSLSNGSRGIASRSSSRQYRCTKVM